MARGSNNGGQQRGSAILADLASGSVAPLEADDVAIVIAHPDDETIGCGAQLVRWTGATVIVITDGAPRNLLDAHAHGFATAEAYAAARRRELVAALAIARVPVARLFQLGVPDQEAVAQLVPITDGLAALFDQLGTAVAVTHAYEGGHPDHDATAFAVHRAANYRQIGIIEMPFYRAAGRESGMVLQRFTLGGPQEVCVALDEEQQRLKVRMVAAHATQARTLSPFALESERFRPAPRHDFTRLPNGGELLYERHNWGMTAERWLRLTRAAEQQCARARGVPCSPS